MSIANFWRVVSEYGDFASIAGLALSFLGFGLTIWSAIDARKAASEARRIIERFKSQLLANDLVESQELMRQISVLYKKSAWTQASHECDTLIIRLSVSSGSRFLTASERDKLSQMLDDLRSIKKRCDLTRRRGTGSREDALDKLSDMLSQIARIQGRLRDDFDAKEKAR